MLINTVNYLKNFLIYNILILAKINILFDCEKEKLSDSYRTFPKYV